MLPIDSTLLGYYNVPGDQAVCLASLLQSQFIYCNDYIRNALTVMVYAMLNKIQEINSLQQENSKIKNDNIELKTICNELESANEALEAEAQIVSELQVQRFTESKERQIP